MRRLLSGRVYLICYLSFARAGTAMRQLVRVAGTRWAVGGCFLSAKVDAGAGPST
ncbi:MAG: hypothetical protein ACYDB7_07505 [Mycobacteriales bacterium]